jgi:hypothetical protein
MCRGGINAYAHRLDFQYCIAELAIHVLDQVHCWGTYFCPGIGHYENFTSLNFQPLLFSKQ